MMTHRSFRTAGLLSALALVMLLASCDQAITTAYTEQLNVACFLYADAPVDSVVLHRTTPFGAYYDDLDFAVDSATVVITVDGVAHTLKAGATKGRYYLPPSELTIEGGKTYTLTVTAPNHQTGGLHHLYATTTVPMPITLDPRVDSIRGRTVTLDTNQLASFAFIVAAGPVDEPNRKYLLTVEALDTSYGKIHQRREGPDSVQRLRYSFTQTGPAIAVTSRLFGWYGPSKLTFYAIDTNWYDYQRQLLAATATLYQPSLNHITGGMGIFASGGRDTVSFVLLPKK